MKKDNRQPNRYNGFKIPKELDHFAHYTLKKFYKENKNFYDDKEDSEKDFMRCLLEYFPRTIATLVRFNSIKEVNDLRPLVYEKIADKRFLKQLRKAIKRGDELVLEACKVLPIVIKNMVDVSIVQHKKDLETDPNAPEYDMSDLIQLSRDLLKKKIKKFKELGVDEEVAFEVLTCVPHKLALEDAQFYHRIRNLMNTFYELAKTHTIQFDEIITRLIPERHAAGFITYLLLERKDKFASMIDKQKEFYVSVNEWIFNKLEETNKTTIETILDAYLKARKRDFDNNRDSDRRYYLKSIPEAEYPKTYAIVKAFMEKNKGMERFF